MFIFGAAISFEAQSSMDIRQLAKVQRAHWRKFSRHSSIGESPGGVLAKVQWTFVNWRKCRGCIGESSVDARQWRNSRLRNSYWRSSGYPRGRRHSASVRSSTSIVHNRLFVIFENSHGMSQIRQISNERNEFSLKVFNFGFRVRVWTIFTTGH